MEKPFHWSPFPLKILLNPNVYRVGYVYEYINSHKQFGMLCQSKRKNVSRRYNNVLYKKNFHRTLNILMPT